MLYQDAVNVYVYNVLAETGKATRVSWKHTFKCVDVHVHYMSNINLGIKYAHM